ncbi:MAG: pre-peptidase C-terminal domain-containing protein [Nostoc sp. DedVER02]|uniref:pre-peptidase C-terminal domain-containing protein n=1 Tax=unclassified Nostoc TaxID=2593658 RepID=UPI002AD43005|nr:MULTISPECIES: pre-peptidase C-terminal domain-containing protein [unclassified Nostoc]MDZ7987797.1 pre-peptidase C-terminal domain-containing protein [Nostoc sp. DedVER02]MDZ8116291.1 pre-peptidase C-terminal domain-containing protein [Nostoc sp. DedVER01b]
MLLEIKNYRRKLSHILICSLSSTLLITSNLLPISALGKPQNSQGFIIAKSPDERQPEAVKKAIEQIPAATQASIAPRRKTSIESPIQNRRISSNTETSRRTSNASNDDDTSRPSRRRTSNSNSNRSSNTSSASRSSRSRISNSNRSNGGSGRGRKPSSNVARSENRNIAYAPVSSPATPTYKEINFVDVALGILSRNDFQSQGRYFHFYEFEGRENQLVQIRLIGSNDTRRSNNLSLKPLLFLHDPDNNIIVKKGALDKSSGGDDAFIFARLPKNGTYKIAVTSRDPGEIGRYSLALRNDRASYTLDEAGQLSANSSTLKQNGGAYNVSNFQGRKNQLISIRVDSVDEEFSPYVALLNSKGQTIAIDRDKDKDGVYSTLIDRARLPEDDTYYIVVTSKNPQERGKYRLTIF